jgi:hypothetical protein
MWVHVKNYHATKRASDQTTVTPMPTFADLVASRREWIESTLKPWCRQAARADLLLAEQEWLNIAGQVNPEKTLWLWAWSRFPALYVEDLPGIEESYAVTVTLRDGNRQTGYPDARRSRQGRLVLIGARQDGRDDESGPLSIDDVREIRRLC